MTVSIIENGFVIGELSPGLYGRTDLARFKIAATTLRNAFVNYRGGASSRAGTKFVGYSKQTGRSLPPRLIPFQFNINQGLILEFGNQYMRVIKDGAFVVDSSVSIINVTQANPAHVTNSGATGGLTAAPDNSAVAISYAPGEQVTLAGGTFTVPTVVQVTNTKLLSLLVNHPGSLWVPADTLTLTGGTQSTPVQLTVATTKVSALPTIAAAGAGGTPGTATVTGTTGTGTPFQATVTIDGGGAIASVDALTVAGDYTVNPTTLANEPVTGGGLAGAQLSLVMGISTVTITNAGVFTANPMGSAFTQNVASGTGVSATFKDALMGVNAATVPVPGTYTSYPPNPVGQASTTGSGVGILFNMTATAALPFHNGDWVQIDGVGGMFQLNGNTYVIGNVTANAFDLFDVFGNAINSTAFSPYSSGGTASRIFTRGTPYSDADLEWLKYTQSADVMSLCLVNQSTGVEYPPYELARVTNSSWNLNQLQTGPTIARPSGMFGIASAPGGVNYAYRVTAINQTDGSESSESEKADVVTALNLQTTAGTINLFWNQVTGAQQYNVYKAPPAYSGPVPIGSLFGYAGTSYGTSFNDNNIVPDFTQVPPIHANPFERGRVLGGIVTAGGVGYTTAGAGVSTSTGSGALLEVVVSNGVVASIVVDAPGKNYLPTDTIVITGDGGGAAAIIRVGALTGTYPSVPAYFQQRRVYANTLNQPDTYFMSQPGSYTNFDYRIPTVDDDAITGTPWGVQVDGVQFMQPLPGGLLCFTGQAAFLVGGIGSSWLNPVAITPNSQQAVQQAFEGISPTVPPIPIDYNVIYTQSHGSTVRNLQPSLYSSLASGEDITINSTHLFQGFQIKQWDWAEEPYKTVWAIRNDGIILSLAFVKAQEVQGWARSDTQGLFKSIAAITELPVDAAYYAVQRFPPGVTDNTYMIERADNRIWDGVEDTWCVDCGLTTNQPTPAATLTASSAKGDGEITGLTGLVGGHGYSAATQAIVVDHNPTNTGDGPGEGADISPVISGGVITGYVVNAGGSGYVNPTIGFFDPANTGSGATARVVLDNSTTFTTPSPVFSASDIGAVIRAGGGIATITAFVSPRSVVANMNVPITLLVPNTRTPQKFPAGQWTLTRPFTVVDGLDHLAGFAVTGIYDGKVLPPQTVTSDGRITLPEPATMATIGLGFEVQVQAIYLDGGQPTIQGRRKDIPAMTARVQASGRFEMGCNQPDGSVQSPLEIAPEWQAMEEAQTPAVAPYNSDTIPLFTGDVRIPIQSGFKTPGQAAVQQRLPLPLNVVAFIPEVVEGDVSQVNYPKRGQG